MHACSGSFRAVSTFNGPLQRVVVSASAMIRVYSKNACFETFPFPPATDDQITPHPRSPESSSTCTASGRQAKHPTLILSDMYNLLIKLRTGARSPTVKGLFMNRV